MFAPGPRDGARRPGAARRPGPGADRRRPDRRSARDPRRAAAPSLRPSPRSRGRGRRSSWPSAPEGRHCRRSRRGSPPIPTTMRRASSWPARTMAAGDRDRAADALLEIIGRDRDWNEGARAPALPATARGAGPRGPVVERAAAAAVGAAVHMSRTIRVPLFPLAGAILFPRSQLPLHIFEPRYRDMVSDAIDGGGRIAMIQPLQRRRRQSTPLLMRSAASARSSASRSSTTAASTSSCSAPTASA